MKIIMIYDQIQSGLGTKDDNMMPLGGVREAIGPAVIMAPHLARENLQVSACLYCGSGLFLSDPSEVSRKLCAMVRKLSPEVVVCGPAYDFRDYGEMCACIAADIADNEHIPAIAAMAKVNKAVIERFKGRIPIVKTPMKGEAGMRQALENICALAGSLARGEPADDLIRRVCFL